MRNVSIAQEEDEAQQAQVIEALRQSVRTLLQLFIGRVHLRAFLEVVKQEAVREAHKLLSQHKADKPPTLSELNIHLGLDTRSIQKLQQQTENTLPRRDICPEAALLARWSRDPAYHNKINDQPMVLSMYGTAYSFQGLVYQFFGRGVSPHMVARRLATQGCVKLLPKAWVQLVHPNWVWIDQEELGLIENAKNALNSFGATLYHNQQTRQPEEKWLERRVFTMKIPEQRQIEAKAQISALALRQKNEMVALMADLEQNECASGRSIGMGYYYWENDGA